MITSPCLRLISVGLPVADALSVNSYSNTPDVASVSTNAKSDAKVTVVEPLTASTHTAPVPLPELWAAVAEIVSSPTGDWS